MPAEKSIHVVAFDVPFPPDYGGVIDTYYRCRSLKEAGFRVILHCFEYGRGRTHDHHSIADEVHYYTRSKHLLDWFSKQPFIVRTRRSTALLERLLKDDLPILFEGQHTTAWLDHPALNDRRKMVRLHNIEWQYYEGLANRTTSWTRRRYFRSESRKLKRHESVLQHASVLACISYSDTDYYQQRFANVVYMPVSFDQSSGEGSSPVNGGFFLFHGNLGVAENEEAALWLIDAFSAGEWPLVLAGKNPSPSLTDACSKFANIRLVANPESATMQTLLHAASAHLVIGFQHSGIKLKLLHSLVTGKRCVATPAMVEGTGLESFCTVVSDKTELMAALELPQPELLVMQAQQEQVRAAFSAAMTVRVVQEYLFD